MRVILTEKNLGRIVFCKAQLDDAGIVCFIRNETIHGTMPYVPAFTPQLCIVNDADEDRAREALAFENAPVSTAPEWICPNCKSSVPANFDTCWSCEKPRPATPQTNPPA